MIDVFFLLPVAGLLAVILGFAIARFWMPPRLAFLMAVAVPAAGAGAFVVAQLIQASILLPFFRNPYSYVLICGAISLGVGLGAGWFAGRAVWRIFQQEQTGQ